MYNAILFDLDGTLTDPKEGITKCVQYALMKSGIEEADLDKLMCFIGPPLVDGFMEYYGMTRDAALKAVEYYRERFPEKGIFENNLIEGVPEMLAGLKAQGKIIALATSKPYVYAEMILKHFDLAKYFDIVVGAEFDGTRNAKKDVITEVLKNLPENSTPVMVGDRMYDVEGAKACMVPCIGVRFGYAEENELVATKAIIIQLKSQPWNVWEICFCSLNYTFSS